MTINIDKLVGEVHVTTPKNGKKIKDLHKIRGEVTKELLAILADLPKDECAVNINCIVGKLNIE